MRSLLRPSVKSGSTTIHDALFRVFSKCFPLYSNAAGAPKGNAGECSRMARPYRYFRCERHPWFLSLSLSLFLSFSAAHVRFSRWCSSQLPWALVCPCYTPSTIIEFTKGESGELHPCSGKNAPNSSTLIHGDVLPHSRHRDTHCISRAGSRSTVHFFRCK